MADDDGVLVALLVDPVGPDLSALDNEPKPKKKKEKKEKRASRRRCPRVLLGSHELGGGHGRLLACGLGKLLDLLDIDLFGQDGLALIEVLVQVSYRPACSRQTNRQACGCVSCESSPWPTRHLRRLQIR